LQTRKYVRHHGIAVSAAKLKDISLRQINLPGERLA
jgi:hypothetical protein